MSTDPSLAFPSLSALLGCRLVITLAWRVPLTMVGATSDFMWWPGEIALR